MSSKQLRRLDENCVFFGLDAHRLMENAGASVAREIIRRVPRGRVALFAGTGNNGGDGFVMARHLSGHEVVVFLLGKPQDIAEGAAMRNFELLRMEEESGRGRVSIVPIRDTSQLSHISLDDFDVVVDAMLGTGVKGTPREPFFSAIRLINSYTGFVVAVDVPSGFEPDTGRYSIAVRADLTVTFHASKLGFAHEDAQRCTGEVQVASIGIPPFLERLVGPGDVHAALPAQKQGHKGQNGRVLVIGGGRYTGAPALAGLAALRAGADIVTVAAPTSVSEQVASFSPDLIVRPLKGELLSPEHTTQLKELIEEHDVVVLGNGLGYEASTVRAVEQLIPMCTRVVLDADALRAVHADTSIECDAVLTPHMGELARIVGRDVPSGLDERCELVAHIAHSTGAVVLAKGKTDIVSDGEDVRLNITGNGAMAVGGTGDVLAGITGALLCRAEPLEAACAAAFINGAAGDLTREEVGYSLLATDVLLRIPRVMAGEGLHERC
ncbi:MAG: NAD(P)H-hydrate dehydratase [Methermicoccaceae archaeon]